ncbi:hypothetical protein ACQQ2N_20145 [Dokdonella sp. MW10]|uniref:hypothetical protein n=1 Tax=Dokdonella sp. MW10 TaxID=2992926 RepID=UPI003F7F5D25
MTDHPIQPDVPTGIDAEHVGEKLAEAVHKLDLAGMKLDMTYQALQEGGHLDAAQIVNAAHLDTTTASLDVVQSIEALGIGVARGFRRRRGELRGD